MKKWIVVGRLGYGILAKLIFADSKKVAIDKFYNITYVSIDDSTEAFLLDDLEDGFEIARYVE